MSALTYTPPKSVEPYLTSESFVSLIVGPVGSTKTTASIIKIAYHASRMAPCKDGIRRSRAIWVRNTKEQLRDTKWIVTNMYLYIYKKRITILTACSVQTA